MRHQQLSIDELTVGHIIGGGDVSSSEKVIYLDPTNGSDGNDGLAITRALKTFAAACAHLANSRQNTIAYVSGTSGITQSVAHFWTTTGLTGGTALNYSKFVGINSGSIYGARSRFSQLAATAVTPMFTVAGAGNYFSDLYWVSGNGEANKNVVTVSGTYNTFERCNFAGPIHATEGADADWRTLIVTGGGNYFKDCMIGINTTLLYGSGALLGFGGSSVNHPFTLFDNCMFVTRADPSALFIKDEGNTHQGAGSLFRGCTFLNVMGDASKMDYAMTWADTGGGMLHTFHNCIFVGVSDIIATANVTRAVFSGGDGATTTLLGIAQQTTAG